MTLFNLFKRKPKPIKVGDKVTGKVEPYSLFIFEVIEEVNGLFKCQPEFPEWSCKYFHASEIERV